MLKILLILLPLFAFALPISEQDTQEIGHKIWKNECSGKVDGLVHWSPNEECLSLGIGHFIWYPKTASQKFDAMFPKYIEFLIKKQIPLPSFVKGSYTPWNNREEFLADHNGREQLKNWLVNTIYLQTEFMIERLSISLESIISKAKMQEQKKIEIAIEELKNTPRGLFALIDYLNFKGDGLNLNERYQGKGWGLYQVLLEMKIGTNDPLKHFQQSAMARLTERVHLAPQDESRWLTGWKNRIVSY